MIEEKEYRKKLSQNIFNIVSLNYINGENADPKIAYALGLLSSISASIATIAMLYQQDNKNDKTDILQFHKIFLQVGTFSYTGSNVHLMADEILKVKEILIQKNINDNKNDLYTITYS